MDRIFRQGSLVAQAILITLFFGVVLSGYIYVDFAITRTLWRYDQEQKWGYLEAIPKSLPFSFLSMYLDISVNAVFPWYLRLAGIKSAKVQLVYPVVSLVASVICWWVGYLPNLDMRPVMHILLRRMERLNEQIRVRERDGTSVPVPQGDIDDVDLRHFRFDTRVIDKERSSDNIPPDYFLSLLGGFHLPLDYPYAPLTRPRSIRVLTLLPSSLFDAPLVCSLSEHSIDEVPEYTALSYAWDTADGFTHVLCELYQLKVTRNCARALHYIRARDGQHYQSIRLWVDAICIDQGDTDVAKAERTQQIQIMGEVYKKASRVVAWIGEHQYSSSEYVCDIVTSVGKAFELENDEEAAWRKAESMAAQKARQWVRFLNSWRELFERSWFTRLWPTQEVVLPLQGRVSLLCGDTTLSWDHVRITWQVLAEMRLLVGSFKLDQAVALQFYLSDAVALKRGQSAAGRKRFGRPLLHDLSELSLTSIMQATRFKACSLAKDKFFAIYGVLQELGISHKVDLERYATMSESEVYFQLFLSCFADDKNFDILRCARTVESYTSHDEFWMSRPAPNDNTANIVYASIANISSTWRRGGRDAAPAWRGKSPSWVPDWTQIMYSDAEERDIALIHAHTTRMRGTSAANRPAVARPRTRIKNCAEPPAFFKLRQCEAPASEQGVTSNTQGLVLRMQGKVVGVVRSVGSVDSFALFWQAFGTVGGFYAWRKHWREAMADRKASKETYFTTAIDAYVAAVIETIRNLLVHSMYGQITLCLRMLHKAVDRKAIAKYACAAFATWISLPYLESAVCRLHPTLSVCGSVAAKATDWFLICGELMFWVLLLLNGFRRGAYYVMQPVSSVVMFIAAALMWKLRGSLYTTMYGEERWAESRPLTSTVFFICFFGQALSFIAAYYDEDILILVLRMAMLLVVPFQAFDTLHFKYLNILITPLATTTAVAAGRCIRGAWAEIRGSNAFRRQGTFTSGLNFYSTETGLTGSTSAPVRVFDVVVVVDWASDPMVLRRTKIGYAVVGAAYVGNKSREDMEKTVAEWESIFIQ